MNILRDATIKHFPDGLPYYEKYAYIVTIGSLVVASLRLVEPFSDTSIFLTGLNTHPHFRRQGCASLILQQIIIDYPQHKIYLDVFEKNTAAINLYLKFGFIRNGSMYSRLIRMVRLP